MTENYSRKNYSRQTKLDTYNNHRQFLQLYKDQDGRKKRKGTLPEHLIYLPVPAR